MMELETETETRNTGRRPEYISGGCECKSIRYRISFPEGSKWPPNSNHCHCSQCRKTLGGLFATLLHIPVADFIHESSKTLKVYQSSEYGRRGFCTHCGGGIYFFETDEPDGPVYCVAAGSVDGEYLNGELLAGLKRDLYSIMAVRGVDDVVGRGLERHVAVVI
ncbi:hypothetical protein AA313_de0207943 [Arthrobotrys entomopaga]|nr:hypothetical protein AA313_de0207943 [Arthrobotrys entomopaga]